MESYNEMKLEQMGEKWMAPGLGVKVRDDISVAESDLGGVNVTQLFDYQFIKA